MRNGINIGESEQENWEIYLSWKILVPLLTSFSPHGYRQDAQQHLARAGAHMHILLYLVSWCWLWFFPFERCCCTDWDGLLPNAKSWWHPLTPPSQKTTPNKTTRDNEWKTFQVKHVQIQTRTHIHIWILFSLHFGYVVLSWGNNITGHLFKEKIVRE